MYIKLYFIITFATTAAEGRWTPVDDLTGSRTALVSESHKSSGELQIGGGLCNQKIFSAKKGIINTNFHCCQAGGNSANAVFFAGLSGQNPISLSCKAIPGAASSNVDSCLMHCPGMPALAAQGVLKSVSILSRKPTRGDSIYSVTNNCGPGNMDCEDSRRASFGQITHSERNLPMSDAEGSSESMFTVDEVFFSSAFSCAGSSGGPVFSAKAGEEGSLLGVVNTGTGAICGGAGFIPSWRVLDWIKSEHPQIYSSLTIDNQKEPAIAVPNPVALVPPQIPAQRTPPEPKVRIGLRTPATEDPIPEISPPPGSCASPVHPEAQRIRELCNIGRGIFEVTVDLEVAASK